MPKFLGYMRKENGFDNFYPLAEFQYGNIQELDKNEVKNFLGDTFNSDKTYYNVNFLTPHRDVPYGYKNIFAPYSLLVFDSDKGEIEQDSNHYPRIRGIEAYDSGYIKTAEEEHIYTIVNESDLSDRLTQGGQILIENSEFPYLLPGQEIFVRLNEDQTLVGPFTLYEEETSVGMPYLYISPEEDYKNLVLKGIEDFYGITFSLKDRNGHVYEVEIIQNPQEEKFIEVDLINDEKLLGEFKAYLNSTSLKTKDRVSIDVLQSIIANNNKSVLNDSSINTEQKTRRLNRIKQLLESETEIQNLIADLNDFFVKILLKDLDSDATNALFQTFIKNAELTEHLAETRAVQFEIERLERQQSDLVDQIKQKEERLNQLETQVLSLKEEEAPVSDTVKERIKNLESDLELSKQENKDLQELLRQYGDLESLKIEKERLIDDIENLKRQQTVRQEDYWDLKKRFESLIQEQQNRMMSVQFDGYLASQLANAANIYEDDQEKEKLLSHSKKLNQIDSNIQDKDSLIEYLITTVQKERPDYTKNTILNLIINICQNLLTVLSGEPGSGKTSISNILGKVLGLTTINQLVNNQDNYQDDLNRFLPISVEKGWTSKRDLIGYFNPLTKKFDASNDKLYNAIRILDLESRESLEKFPYLVLLDEANLSPMEYYWSDFMRLADLDDKQNMSISLGDTNVYNLSDSFHYIATINNDQTTEPLSARLIDRAPVIVLPYPGQIMKSGTPIQEEDIEVIEWKLLKDTFVPKPDEIKLSHDIQEIYDLVFNTFRKNKITISPRTDQAIKRYWTIASKLFDSEKGYSNEIAALDYAVAQRLLPKINGSQNEFYTVLQELLNIFEKYGLKKSTLILREIMRQGEKDYYYHFF